MSRNVIVIGGVALGPKAASRLKRLDPTANVTMIDENINISFGGCGIPYYVSGEINSLDALRSTTYGTVRTPEYFEHKGVHTLNQTRVTAIDRAAKTVTAKNLVTGEEKALPYDRLIIATGSTPKVPPVEGRDLKNVGGANNLEDADALRKACASGSVQNAVVIGAGFIGMEIAVALADMWDIKTSVVEFMPQAMPGVMSASLSDMVRHDLEEHNVDVYTGENGRGNAARRYAPHGLLHRHTRHAGQRAGFALPDRRRGGERFGRRSGHLRHRLRAQHSAGPRRRARS